MNSDNNECKIFVGNVPFQCTKEEFEKCFENLEGFVAAEIINRFNSSFSRGFGFITFDNQENARKALLLQQTSGIAFKERQLRLSEYNFEGLPKTQTQIDNSHKNFIFIKNVQPETTRDILYNTFMHYGPVIRCFINTDIKTGLSKGTAIVEIDDNMIVEALLLQKILTLENGNTLELIRWNNKTKPSLFSIKNNKKPKNIDQNDLYRTAFNAGRSIGFQEGIQISKNNAN